MQPFTLHFLCLDENDCYDCEEILKELERIDDEADDLEIMFVKIRDVRFARKYGIGVLPTLVFFRKKFPSVYRGKQRKRRRKREREICCMLSCVGILCYIITRSC